MKNLESYEVKELSQNEKLKVEAGRPNLFLSGVGGLGYLAMYAIGRYL